LIWGYTSTTTAAITAMRRVARISSTMLRKTFTSKA
jgi:hypothetical protein